MNDIIEIDLSNNLEVSDNIEKYRKTYIRLYATGSSVNSIADKFHVDPRTMYAWIRNYCNKERIVTIEGKEISGKELRRYLRRQNINSKKRNKKATFDK